MTLDHLMQAIQDCNQGLLDFNLGNSRSFLWGKSWYPLRATINAAATYAHERNDLTTHSALNEIVGLGIWTRIAEIQYHFSFPVPLRDLSIHEEAMELSKIIITLLN